MTRSQSLKPLAFNKPSLDTGHSSRHSRFAFACASLMLLSLGASKMAQAQSTDSVEETPWYQVEVLIFTQPQQDLNIEQWDLDTRTQLSAESVQLRAPDSDQTNNTQAFTLLPASQRSLPVNINALSNRNYQILFHEAWQQPLLAKEQALPIHIHNQPQLYTGNKPADPSSVQYQNALTAPAIDGEITLTIARYLHLQTNLYYSVDAPDYWRIKQQQTATPDTSESQPPAMDNRWQAFTQQAESSYVGADSSREAQVTIEQEPLPRLLTVNLDQARRMRGDEVHYLDHPLFGMVIRLSKIEPPAPPVDTAAPASDTSNTGAQPAGSPATTAPAQP